MTGWRTIRFIAYDPVRTQTDDFFYKFFETPIGLSASIAQAQVAALQEKRSVSPFTKSDAIRRCRRHEFRTLSHPPAGSLRQRSGRSRWARADASATGPNPAVFPRPEFAGGSRIHTKLAQPAPRDDSTRRNFSRFGTLDRTRELAGVRITSEERYPRRKLPAARVRAAACKLARRNRDPSVRSSQNNGL